MAKETSILPFIRNSIVTIILSSLIRRSFQEPNRQRDTKQILDDLMQFYDFRIRPSGLNQTDDPVDVTVSMMFLDFTSVSDFDMDFGVQVYFRQEWHDERFKFEDYGNIKYITLTDAYKVWTPGIYFNNEKDAQLHKILAPNVFLRIYPSGNVLYSSRLSLTLSCLMQLERFPFDSNECSLKISSYAYTSRDIQLRWKESNPIQVTKRTSVIGFTVKELRNSTCTSSSGDFTSPCVTMRFQRQTKYYLWHTFLPSGFLVALTWGAFLTDRQAVHIRCVLVLSSLYGLSSIAAEVEAGVPHVDYLKASDIWLGTCFIFLLTALLEFAFVCGHGVSAAVGERDASSATTVVDMKQQGCTKGGAQTKEKTLYKSTVYQQLLQKLPTDSNGIDSLARRVFPALFMGFSVLYFYEYCL